MLEPIRSNWLYVCSLETLWAVLDVKHDLLAIVQSLVTILVDSGVMYKDIFAGVNSGYETITFFWSYHFTVPSGILLILLLYTKTKTPLDNMNCQRGLLFPKIKNEQNQNAR